MDGKKIDQLWHEAPEDREAPPGRGVRGVLAPALGIFIQIRYFFMQENKSGCFFSSEHSVVLNTYDVKRAMVSCLFDDFKIIL